MFVWNISHSKKNLTRYYHKYKLVCMQNTRYSSHILTNLEFSRQIFEKGSNIKFYEKSVQLEPSCSIQTDKHTDKGTGGRKKRQRGRENEPKKNVSRMETFNKTTK